MSPESVAAITWVCCSKAEEHQPHQSTRPALYSVLQRGMGYGLHMHTHTEHVHIHTQALFSSMYVCKTNSLKSKAKYYIGSAAHSLPLVQW